MCFFDYAPAFKLGILTYLNEFSIMYIKDKRRIINMAKNLPYGDGHRQWQVTGRSQTHNPKINRWIKRDADTGRFIDQKADKDPFKGIRKKK